MINFLVGPIIGAVLYHLYNEHRKRGVDKCHKCGHYEQIGKRLRYIPVSNVDLPFCKKCKPEIFP